MNEQPLPTLQPELDAFAPGPDQPFPTIEPEMVALLAAIDDPVIDATPPALALDPNTFAFAPASAEPMPAPAQDGFEPGADGDLSAHLGRPISSVMDRTLWTVHAEDSIEKVEAILAEQNLSSAPVVGSNGAIIGMISGHELSQFHAEGKNAKVVQAWEIARIKTFEVSPRDTVEDVVKLMAENKVENISVTECGRLKGIVSTQDLLLDMLKAVPDAGGR